MSDTQTDRFALPLLQPGQAQKEMTHNEALAALDVLVQPVVEAVGADTPPGAPVPGQCWLVGAAPTAAWAGKAHHLAGWTGGGWRFIAPVEGMSAWVASGGPVARYRGGVWVQGGAVAAPAGGTVIDVEARAALTAVLTVLRMHGLIPN